MICHVIVKVWRSEESSNCRVLIVLLSILSVNSKDRAFNRRAEETEPAGTFGPERG
jgi:hypothetical protein